MPSALMPWTAWNSLTCAASAASNLSPGGKPEPGREAARPARRSSRASASARPGIAICGRSAPALLIFDQPAAKVGVDRVDRGEEVDRRAAPGGEATCRAAVRCRGPRAGPAPRRCRSCRRPARSPAADRSARAPGALLRSRDRAIATAGLDAGARLRHPRLGDGARAALRRRRRRHGRRARASSHCAKAAAGRVSALSASKEWRMCHAAIDSDGN